MITVVCWLWYQDGEWPKYDEEHVHRLMMQLEANTTVPYNFVCITDGYFPVMTSTYPLPDLGYSSPKWHESRFPQCFNRLWMFSEEAGEIFGDIISIDLDVQITGNIDHILTRKEDFVINKGNPARNGYSGSMWKLNAGARTQVWDQLSQEEIIKATTKYTGSDQAWIRYVLGPDEAKYTEEDDGVYHYHYLKKKQKMDTLPKNTSMVFFAGRKKPEDVNYKWVS